MRKDSELLQFAIENGMIDRALIEDKIEMKKRQEILKKHIYKIYEGKDGKWYTYLPDEEKGRVFKKRNTQEAIEDLVIQFYKEREEKETPKTFNDAYKHWRSVQDTLVRHCSDISADQ
jgi:hypothetical protein